MDPPGNYKKVAPGKKEQIFSKTVSVAASAFFTLRKQPPRHLLIKYLFGGRYLPGKCVSVRGIGVSWKIVSVRGLDRVFWKIVGVRGLDKVDRASWKMSICSMRKWRLPGKWGYVFEV